MPVVPLYNSTCLTFMQSCIKIDSIRAFLNKLCTNKYTMCNFNMDAKQLLLLMKKIYSNLNMYFSENTTEQNNRNEE